jgi:hypothetical protein
MLLSLKTLLIVLREFFFLEPSVHGVNKLANDVEQLGEKKRQIALLRRTFSLHKVTFL